MYRIRVQEKRSREHHQKDVLDDLVHRVQRQSADLFRADNNSTSLAVSLGSGSNTSPEEWSDICNHELSRYTSKLTDVLKRNLKSQVKKSSQDEEKILECQEAMIQDHLREIEDIQFRLSKDRSLEAEKAKLETRLRMETKRRLVMQSKMAAVVKESRTRLNAREMEVSGKKREQDDVDQQYAALLKRLNEEQVFIDKIERELKVANDTANSEISNCQQAIAATCRQLDVIQSKTDEAKKKKDDLEESLSMRKQQIVEGLNSVRKNLLSLQAESAIDRTHLETLKGSLQASVRRQEKCPPFTEAVKKNTAIKSKILHIQQTINSKRHELRDTFESLCKVDAAVAELLSTGGAVVVGDQQCEDVKLKRIQSLYSTFRNDLTSLQAAAFLKQEDNASPS